MAGAAMVGVPEGDGPLPPTRLGRYLLFDAFARGGMASVHLGRFEASPGLSRVVAIKRLHVDADRDGRLAQRLREEARLLFRVRHPNVVPLLDLVVTGDDMCLVLEYVHGASFSTLLAACASDGSLASDPRLVSIVVSVAADVLRGLHAAHEARAPDGSLLGIVHRDVSPQNIVVGLDGTSRILDFGIAKALGRDKLTKTGTTLGKVVYMSPEQLKGLPLTAQADLYSVGVVLWEALTGRSFADALEKATAAPAPSTLNPAVPPAVDRVVMRALSRDARARFATGEEMAAELEEACARAPAADVTRFVERFAGDDLERRAELVHRVERAAAPADTAGDQADPPLEIATDRDMPVLPVLPELAAPTLEFPILSESFAETGGDVGRHEVTVPRRQRSSSLPMIAMIGAAMIFFAALALAFTQAAETKAAPAPAAEPPPSSRPPALSSPLATPTPSAPTPTPTPTPPPLPLPADPGSEALEILSAKSPKALASAGERGLRRVAPKSESRAQPRPSAKVGSRGAEGGCDPPFTIDRDGKKRYRPECLQ